MKHEALPHAEHAQVNRKFWHQVIPEVRLSAMRAAGTLLEDGTLRQSSASRLFQDLWNFPDVVFVNRPRNWPVAKTD